MGQFINSRETVVTEGSDRLANGIPVEIVPGTEPRAAGAALAPPATAAK